MKVYDCQATRIVKERWGVKASPAIQVGDFYFLSGLTSIDLDTGDLVDGDIRTQATRTVRILERVLNDCGLTLDNVVKVNATLTHPSEDFADWCAVFDGIFNEPYPVRTTIGGCLVAGRIELEFTAHRESRVGSQPVAE